MITFLALLLVISILMLVCLIILARRVGIISEYLSDWSYVESYHDKRHEKEKEIEERFHDTVKMIEENWEYERKIRDK